ncbi:hypothetical protein [Spiroplasma monobiae]|uniref:Major facilitator superfamily (MFS) profile domain-containing protein n=1 Tax=Spiroplasma monobiae MQ-1 TaxID=1336748 RepID=A0A2K9LTN0_SPISQ|nr:hypothetical protein [Spiroplasma monobiae]AUM62397.1 hypothetical protein SMONO_v1c01460 [Spiroplasma monobiae MQ-1]
MKDNKKRISFDITITAMLLSVGACLKLIFPVQLGIDLTFLVIIITGLFFKTKISLISTIGIAGLSFIIISDPLYWAATSSMYLIFNIFIVLLKKVILRNRSIVYISTPFFGLMITTLYLLISIVVYGRTEGYALYLLHLHEAYVIFFMYCFLIPIVLKQILKFMIRMEEKHPSVFNNKFKEYIVESELDMKNFSDKKNNYNIQITSMVLSLMLLISYFSYVPYAMVIKLDNINYLSAIIIVPTLMLFVTPGWMKLAKKIGNQNLLRINSIGVLFALIFTFSSFATNKNAMTIGFLFTGLVLFGIFIAGFLPINIESIKSYEKRNNLKNKTSKYNSLFGFVLLPLPFLLNYFVGNVYVLAFFMVFGITIVLLISMNKNIMSEGNVLDIQKGLFAKLKNNKKFFSEVFIQNYFIGFFKFLDWSLVLFYFISFTSNGIEINWTENKLLVLLFLISGFILKYIAQAIFSNIKFKNTNVNRIAMATTIFSVILFIAFLTSNLFMHYESVNYVYYSIVTLLMFVFGTSYALIEKTKAQRFRTMVGDEEFPLAMIIDHVMGNAFFSLIIAVTFFTTILLTKTSLLGLIILMSIFAVIAIILLIINVSIKNKKEN